MNATVSGDVIKGPSSSGAAVATTWRLLVNQACFNLPPETRSRNVPRFVSVQVPSHNISTLCTRRDLSTQFPIIGKDFLWRQVKGLRVQQYLIAQTPVFYCWVNSAVSWITAQPLSLLLRAVMMASVKTHRLY